MAEYVSFHNFLNSSLHQLTPDCVAEQPGLPQEVLRKLAAQVALVDQLRGLDNGT